MSEYYFFILFFFVRILFFYIIFFCQNIILFSYIKKVNFFRFVRLYFFYFQYRSTFFHPDGQHFYILTVNLFFFFYIWSIFLYINGHLTLCRPKFFFSSLLSIKLKRGSYYLPTHRRKFFYERILVKEDHMVLLGIKGLNACAGKVRQIKGLKNLMVRRILFIYIQWVYYTTLIKHLCIWKLYLFIYIKYIIISKCYKKKLSDSEIKIYHRLFGIKNKKFI